MELHTTAKLYIISVINLDNVSCADCIYVCWATIAGNKLSYLILSSTQPLCWSTLLSCYDFVHRIVTLFHHVVVLNLPTVISYSPDDSSSTGYRRHLQLTGYWLWTCLEFKVDFAMIFQLFGHSPLTYLTGSEIFYWKLVKKIPPVSGWL